MAPRRNNANIIYYGYNLWYFAIIVGIILLVLSILIIPYKILLKTNYNKSFTDTSSNKHSKYEHAQKKVYCCWTGNNSMSYNRQKCYESIKQNIGVELVLITPHNLHDIIIAAYPLHKAYEYLSYTHKADYLRTYIMHIYGGGYTDIKNINYSWAPYFEVLNNWDTKWALGTNELGAATVACSQNCDWVSDNWEKVISNCSYIFKKQTPLTTEWFNQMNTLLDNKYEELKTNPAQVPDDHIGKEITSPDGKTSISKYPLKWAEMLGDIFHPLCYKYHDKLIHALPPLNTSNYR